MNANSDVIEHGAIAINGSSIIYVGLQDGVNFDAKQTIDVQNKIVIPGLINGHTHIPMTLLRGISDDKDLMDWLIHYIWPAEKENVNPEFVYWGTMLGCLEMIQTGTTTFADMYFFEDDIARATQECGLRAILAESVIDFPVPDNKIEDPQARWENGLSQVRNFANKWKGNDLITPAIGPHAPYTVSPEHLKNAADLAKELGIPVLIHLSETEHEMDQIKKAYNVDAVSPVQYLSDLGFLSSNVIAAHTVWTSKDDVQALVDAGVGVVHCPQSNLKLGAGIASVGEFLHMGLSTCLGTDGAASNNDLIMWEEINQAAILHKGVNQNPKLIDAKTAFSMATIQGAKAIHMDQQIGSLEVGKKADIVIVNNKSSHQVPYGVENIYSLLVYATKGSDVETTIVNGKVLMRDKQIPHLSQGIISGKALQLRQKILQTLSVKK